AAGFTLVSSQTVYLAVSGTGKAPVLGDGGYSDYNSLGGYTLFGFGDQQQPPSAPVGLSLRRISGSQLELRWQPGLGVDAYNVFRDGSFIVNTESIAIIDTGLTPATVYTYRVSATNQYGSSGLSEPAIITTLDADEFVMDGEPDFFNYLLSDPGMRIFAAVRGNRLYVSTWSPGSWSAGFGSDHHIMISDVLLASAMTDAPWAKRGKIAIPGNKPFLAGEESSDYAGWFNTSGDTTLFKAPVNSLQMEGSIDMVQEFGSVPDTVYVAAIAYETHDESGSDPNWGRINAQAPAPTVVNDDLEPEEFLAIPVGRIRDTAMDGVYDILSPERAFSVVSFGQTAGKQMRLDWYTVPDTTFRVYRQTGSLSNTWNMADQQTSGTTQWNLSFTDTNAPATNVFYQLRLP
ncbi:MAG: fibronectin type III domain-containing protein, partial [Verrucomicrobia bacterium]|nr:fibronectin type III domain-containing protein [Verrucomicrobiota bacterium]